MRYSEDLERIATTGEVTPEDHARVEALAAGLARIHREKRDAPEVWAQCLRDLSNGIASALDDYDAAAGALPSPEARRLIEHWAVDWRHRLKRTPGRLARVHGDFIPSNVVFVGRELRASEARWGEPADDLAAMAMSLVSCSMSAGHPGPFRTMFQVFFEAYLTETEDLEVLQVIAPFLGRRALILASPLSPVPLSVRARVLDLIVEVMERGALDLDDLDHLFQP